MTPLLKEKLSRLPREPGAYLMKDARGGIIYVGKAKNLKSRVSSYFGAKEQLSLKTRALVEEVYDFEVIITKTEVEALLLERTMIKHHKPRFNVLLRDDKEYPWLRIDLTEEWPRIEKVRRRRNDQATYLGPFASASQMHTLLDATYRIFPLIRCSRHEFQNAKRPCTYYHMKMCLGPCTLPVSREQYLNMMKDAIAFLSGRNHEVVRNLKARMEKAADDEHYELAALLRDQLRAFSMVTEKQAVVINENLSADVIGLAESESRLSFHLLTIREGMVVASDNFILRSPVHTAPEAMTEFMLQYYDGRSIPEEILLPFAIEDQDDLREALLAGHPELARLVIKAPSRGSRHELIDMANKNAVYHLNEMQVHSERQRIELELVKDKLKLSHLPRRMECIDISNIQGTAIVASNVCFIDGKPAKEFYRHYIVREVIGRPDDFASIREVVRRRLTRGIEYGDLPDLLVIDGGKGQLSAAYGVVKDMNVTQMELISLAKSRVEKKRHRLMDTTAPQRTYERVFFPDKEAPLPLAPGTPEYRLLTQIRDEAHRFAITHHRKRRGKIATGSSLLDIPGIGPSLRQKLIETFGGFSGLEKASLDELRRVKGLRESSAVALYSRLQQQNEDSETIPDLTRGPHED